MPSRLNSLVAAAGVTVLLCAMAACDTDDGRAMVPPDEAQRAAQPTSTSSTTTTLVPGLGDTGLPTTPAEPFIVTAPWVGGDVIDARFTCDGDDISPALRWTTPPAGTIELALLVSDDDAPDFVHWAVAGIAPAAGEVTEGATIEGAIEGLNGAGGTGWTGPCPPGPGETHTYRVTVYALSQASDLAPGFDGAELTTLAFDTSFEAAEIIGTYTRAAATSSTTTSPTTSAPVSTS